jgi:hypothetical protein
MNVCVWSGFPTSDKLYITQLLPTEYSINITNGSGRYQYNKQWMYIYGVDIRPNIHLTYTGIRWISDWIFIWCMHGSGGFLTKYSFSVCRGQANCRPNIHLVNAGIRQIADQIFIWWMQGSGGLLTKYSFGECRGQADFQLNIQLVCAGIRWITDQIFIWCMHKQITNWIFINCTRWIGIEYLVVGMIGLGRLELNIQWSEWLD